MKANFTNPANGRYYFMVVSENLFGQPEIIISRGSHRVKSIIRYLSFDNTFEAMREFYKLACIRIKHGYRESIK